MKVNTVAVVLLSATSASAFCQHANQAFMRTSCLDAHKNDWLAPVAAAAVGWTLTAQVALAGGVPTMEEQQQQVPPLQSSLVVSVLEKKEEAVNEKLDFSFPVYGANTKGGFGDGTEAILTKSSSDLTDPGAGEKDKQLESMRRAEAAKKERLEKQKEEAKAREAEDRRRAAEKKAEKAERMKHIFD